jgi:hypothetical protein
LFYRLNFDVALRSIFAIHFKNKAEKKKKMSFGGDFRFEEQETEVVQSTTTTTRYRVKFICFKTILF